MVASRWTAMRGNDKAENPGGNGKLQSFRPALFPPTPTLPRCNGGDFFCPFASGSSNILSRMVGTPHIGPTLHEKGSGDILYLLISSKIYGC